MSEDFAGKDLRGQDFTARNLAESVMVGANLTRATLYRTDLHEIGRAHV